MIHPTLPRREADAFAALKASIEQATLQSKAIQAARRWGSPYVPPYSFHPEAALIRLGQVLILKHEVRAIRAGLEAKFNPDQPRLPAGAPGGGRWTDGGGITLAQGRGRLPGGGWITPAQQARLSRSQAERDTALQVARRIDPAYRPQTQSLSSRNSVEASIAHNQAVAREARDFTASALRPMQEIVTPSAGWRARRADSDMLTVTPQTYAQMQATLLSGARREDGPLGYAGHVYRRYDGSLFGLRRSAGSGETIDVIGSPINIIRKIHQGYQR